MFKKLLSNLPFNPSLVGKVSFYAKRLHAESSIRRMGFAFLALSLVVQGFAAISPSRPAIASDNDMIPGGFADQAAAVNACNDNSYQFKTILRRFSINCEDLFFGSVRRIDYSEYDGNMYSMGRNPYAINGERPVSIDGVGTFYMRPLANERWGRHCYNDGANCMALTGTRPDGTPFWILLGCGNLVIYGPPNDEPPPEEPKIPEEPKEPQPEPKVVVCNALLMSVANNATVPVGTTINLTGRATGQNLDPNELADMSYDYVNASNGQTIGHDEAHGVPFVNGTATDDIPRTFTLEEPGTFVFKLAIQYHGFNGNADGSNQGECVKQVNVERPIPCEEAENPDDLLACLEFHKKARNETQGIEDANGTKANPGDIIVYTLSVTNRSSNQTVPGFVVEESVSDILEYASIEDLHGGVKDDNDIVRWPATDIAAGQTIEKEITIKVDERIRQTPVSTTNPGSFDLTMTNVYGDIVNIKLPKSRTKQVESINTTLPNTGPGETLAVAVVITVGAGYFFARSRLMAKELDMVRTDYATSGGNT